jgi:hypothetical protein
MCHENKRVKFVGEPPLPAATITPASSPKNAIGASWGRARSAPALSFSASGEAGYIFRTPLYRGAQDARQLSYSNARVRPCPLVRVLPFGRCCGCFGRVRSLANDVRDGFALNKAFEMVDQRAGTMLFLCRRSSSGAV